MQDKDSAAEPTGARCKQPNKGVMEEELAFPADGQSECGKQTQRPILRHRGCTGRDKCFGICNAAETATSRAVRRFAVDGQHATETGSAIEVRGRLMLAEVENRQGSTFDAVTRLRHESSIAGDGVHGDPYQPTRDRGFKGDSAFPPPSRSTTAHPGSLGSSVTAAVEDYEKLSRDYVWWLPTTSRVTQLASRKVLDEPKVNRQFENTLRCVLSTSRMRECGGATEITAEAIQKSTEFCEPLPVCKQGQLVDRVNLSEGLGRRQDVCVKADSSDRSSVQPELPEVYSLGSLHDAEWHYVRGRAPSTQDSKTSHTRTFQTAGKPPAITAAVHGVGLGASVNAVGCPSNIVSAPVDVSSALRRLQRQNRRTGASDDTASDERASKARRPMVRLFSRTPQLERLKQRQKRTLSLSVGQHPSDQDPPKAECSVRTTSRVASLASVARSCMQRRLSAGMGNEIGRPLLTSRNSRSVHHVFFRVSSGKRRSFQKPPTENGSATEASENGKTASSRTSSSGTITDKCAPYTVGEYGYRECDYSKDVALADLEKKQLNANRAAALGEASAMVAGTQDIDGQDRRLLHRVDPARLLRVSCSKCFSDDQTRQTRFADVNRPIVCEERFSSRYFRKKGDASGAPGSWLAGDAGSTVFSRRLACMLVREVQRELRYGFYPTCTRASMMWVSLLGSILFLSIGAWLTVEDERHVECRLNYESETLQEGGSRYSLLSITADLCSGRLHSLRLNTTRPDEKSSSYESGKRGSRWSSSDEREASREPSGPSNSRRSRGSQFEESFPDDSRSRGTRKNAARRRAVGFSASSSAPLSYFFNVPPPARQPVPQTNENASVVSELSGPYIYVYIEMDRFYQNDAQVVWSRKDEQLAGKVFTDPRDLKECEPAVTAVVDNVTKILHPCGVLAWNVFTDRFQFLDAVPDDSIDAGPVRPLVLEQNQDVLLNSFGDWRKRFKNPPADVRAKYRDRVYFWMSLSDNDDGKDMYKTREEAKAELLMDRLNYEEAGEMVENGHFIQWMHTAPFGKWRKFYGRIRGPVKLPLFAYIAVTYDVKQWRGKKAIVLVQPSRFSGRTQFLGSAYLFFGILLVIVAGYSMWRKCGHVSEEDDLRDLRWRARRKGGKKEENEKVAGESETKTPHSTVPTQCKEMSQKPSSIK